VEELWMPSHPFVPVANVAEAKLNWQWYVDRPMVTRLHYIASGVSTPISVADLTDLGNAIKAWWNGTTKSKFSDHLDLFTIDLRDLGIQATAIATVLVDVTGTSTQDTVAPQLSSLVKIDSGTAGRARRGRIFWPPPFVGQTQTPNNSVLTSTALNDIVGLTTNLGTLTGSLHTWNLVIASRAGGVGAHYTVQNFTGRANLATQRRRGNIAHS
jgi:hypothetical protein